MAFLSLNLIHYTHPLDCYEVEEDISPHHIESDFMKEQLMREVAAIPSISSHYQQPNSETMLSSMTLRALILVLERLTRKDRRFLIQISILSLFLYSVSVIGPMYLLLIFTASILSYGALNAMPLQLHKSKVNQNRKIKTTVIRLEVIYKSDL